MSADTIAFWSMIGTWFSGIATLVAAIAAFRALGTWKEQERIKDLKELKSSIFNYRNILIEMPEIMDWGNPSHATPIAVMEGAINDVMAKMSIAELDSQHDEIEQIFIKLRNSHDLYIRRKIDKHEHARTVNFVISKRFLEKE